jgi:hydroxymethylbilane synthase
MLEGGCSLPVGAHAVVDGARLSVAGMVCSPDGAEEIRESVSGQAADPETAGRQLAGLLLEQGAARLLARYAGVES